MEHITILEAPLVIHIPRLETLLYFLYIQMLIGSAAWQLRKGFEWRLEPERVYDDVKINGDSEKDTVAHGSTPPRVVVGLKTMLSPWCGIGYPYENYASTEEGKTEEPGVNDV